MVTEKQHAYYWGFLLYATIHSPWWGAIEDSVCESALQRSIKI